MRQSRNQSRRVLGFLLLLTLALLSLSSLPVATADVEEAAEAAVDASGDVQVDEPAVEEPVSSEEDVDAAVEEAMRAAEAEMAAAKAAAAEAAAKAEAEAAAAAAAAAEKAEAEAAAAAEKAKAEAAAAAAAAVIEEEESKTSTAFVDSVAESAKSKAMSFFGKAKEITPEKMKKVAAGALGVWGVAAGAGWVMNNLGGEE